MAKQSENLWMNKKGEDYTKNKREKKESNTHTWTTAPGYLPKLN